MDRSGGRFFPFPKIFLKQARARGKGVGTVDHQLAEPGELRFYTSTRPEDNGNTDTWAPVPDIDFSLIRSGNAVPLPFTSRFAHSPKQADARPADFGQTRFTITLDATEEAVDLMHGRASAGIEARVTAVSAARGGADVDLGKIKPSQAVSSLGALAGAMSVAQTIGSISEVRWQHKPRYRTPGPTPPQQKSLSTPQENRSDRRVPVRVKRKTKPPPTFVAAPNEMLASP